MTIKTNILIVTILGFTAINIKVNASALEEVQRFLSSGQGNG